MSMSAFNLVHVLLHLFVFVFVVYNFIQLYIIYQLLMYVLYFTWDVIAVILNGLFNLQAEWCVHSDGLFLGTRRWVQLSNWSHFVK